MASELSTPGWEHVGDVDVKSSFGDPPKALGVWRRPRDGAVNLDVPYSDLILDAEGRDKLRELLDRAAMPGQPAFYLAHVRFENGEEFGLYRERADADGHVARRAAGPGVRLTEVLSLAVIEPDQAAPPALTVAAVDPELAERMGEIADAAQEAGGDAKRCAHCGGEIRPCENGCPHHATPGGGEGSIFCDPGNPASRTAEEATANG